MGPEYDRKWLGRALCHLPAPGQDEALHTWQGVASDDTGGPVPRCLGVGFEWVEVELAEVEEQHAEIQEAMVDGHEIAIHATVDGEVQIGEKEFADGVEDALVESPAKARRMQACCAWSPWAVCCASK